MEGYFNFGFTNSVRKSSAWFLSQRATESNYKIDVEWSCDSVERNSMEDVDTIDTDLDSDSFLSDLEKDSGEQRGEGGERSQRYSHRDWEEAVQRTSNSQEREEREEREEVRGGESLAGSLSQVRGAKPSVETGGDGSWCCYFTQLDISCITGLLSLSALIFCLIAPDWVTNTAPHQSALIRLNPWDICLSRLEVNSSLGGCYSSWDLQLAVMPAWFLLVPASLLLVSSLSLSARAFLFLIWFKKRQIFPLKLGLKLMLSCVVLDSLSGLLLLCSTMMFAAAVLSSPGLSASAPSSALSLSWGWAAGLTSSWGHLATAILLAREALRERKKREQNENFIRNIPA